MTSTERILIVLLLAATTAVVAPSDSSCHSVQDDQNGRVHCSREVVDPAKFSKYLERIRFDVTSLELHELTIDALPPDMLQNHTHVKQLLFDSVHIKLFNIPELGPSPLQGPKDKIERLEVYNSDGLFAWDWSLFPTMKNLKSLVVDNSKLISVPFDLGRFAPNLYFLELTDSILKFIHPDAFKKLADLGICNLAGNEIPQLQRSMFPSPAEKLWTIDFSDNKLTLLPDDIFSDMPLLKEIKLDGNNLAHISPLRRIWPQLSHLWLQGNQLQCPLLCWTTQENYSPIFYDSTQCWYKNIRVDFVQEQATMPFCQ